MRRTEWGPLLAETCRIATEFLERLPERAVAPIDDAIGVLRELDQGMPEEGQNPRDVIAELVHGTRDGLTAMAHGRFYGWVIGGGLPSAVAADWLTTVWDQNAGSADGTPAAAALEHLALRWVGELLALPVASAVLVTGATMASFTALAVARSEVLRAAGWDVEADGLQGAPRVRVVVGAERHGTIDKALRMLGIGTRQLVVVDADREGRMIADALARALAGSTDPTIVCAQAGNVNGGAFDPLAAIADEVAVARTRAPTWLHLDGAFGLWARVAPARAALAEGAEHCDSWSTDAHKWLNTPYDCGIMLTRHAAAHRRVMRGGAAYLPEEGQHVPNPFDLAPELSRRARGFALWAALRELGRRGVADLVERTCAHADSIARGLAAIPGVEVMNEVKLNQIVVACGDDARTRGLLERVVKSGVCYPTGTVWRGRAAIRISVSNWTTDEEDVRRTVEIFRSSAA